jgi:hypothetical protein
MLQNLQKILDRYDNHSAVQEQEQRQLFTIFRDKEFYCGWHKDTGNRLTDSPSVKDFTLGKDSNVPNVKYFTF